MKRRSVVPGIDVEGKDRSNGRKEKSREMFSSSHASREFFQRSFAMTDEERGVSTESERKRERERVINY